MPKPNNDPISIKKEGDEPDVTNEGGQGGQVNKPRTQGTEPGDEEALMLQQAMVKRGFKNVKDLVDSLDKSEKKITELSNLNRIQTLSAPSQFVAPGPGQVQEEEPDLPDDIYNEIADNAKAKQLFKKFGKQIRDDMTNRFMAYEKNKEISRIKNEAATLIQQDPKKFFRLRSKMIELAEQPEYQQANLQTLYHRAEEIEKEEREELKNSLKKDILGEDIDPQRLKALISKLKPAPIVGEGGGSIAAGTLTEDERKEAEKRLKEEIFGPSNKS
jgi:hypothetical protein